MCLDDRAADGQTHADALRLCRVDDTAIGRTGQSYLSASRLVPRWYLFFYRQASLAPARPPARGYLWGFSRVVVGSLRRKGDLGPTNLSKTAVLPENILVPA